MTAHHPSLETCIQVHGARTHNLQNVDVAIPRDQLVVITGPSGSGKSSLAFDTIYAEGKRQYIETLSIYARQFLDQIPRPEVDLIEGLPPTLCIDQRPGHPNPRSTVATVTEIHDHLRLMMARLGVASCFRCNEPVRPRSVAEIVERCQRLPEGTRLIVLAPYVHRAPGSHEDVFEKIRRGGFVRVRVDSVIFELDHAPTLDPQQEHTIEAVVDRIIVRNDSASRLADSVRLALQHGNGRVTACTFSMDTAGDAPLTQDESFTTKAGCTACGAEFPPLEPRTFSFNSPYGACPDCDGLGWRKTMASADTEDQEEAPTDFPVVCSSCQGTRLRPEARSVRIQDRSIDDITSMSIEQCHQFVQGLKFDGTEKIVSQPILAAIQSRLQFLREVGLNYLTLDRAADSLSGGEFQRVRLASSIGSGLVGVCFVLDEPSIGLHQRDNQRLIETLRRLQQQGNTVLVVEHDEEVMRSADHLIDVGPGAGRHGGRIIAAGRPDDLARHPDSRTGAYLSGQASIELPSSRRKVSKSRQVEVIGASLHNLREVHLMVPTGVLVCVTGVSGSGKSSLIHQTLAPILLRHLGRIAPAPGPFQQVRGAKHIRDVIVIDQTPAGATSRSNAATYSGAFDLIRKVFAATNLARQRGFRASRFSFNNRDGRCPVCQGQGVQKLAMSFLPDMLIPCPECEGTRFNRATLAVRYRGKSIADMLAMSVEEALDFFANYADIAAQLQCLADVGLGYLPLGQPATTFSGGEAQRVKLAKALVERTLDRTGDILYLLDEPTTGLHFDDIARLVRVLQRLVDQGNTVLVIEHNIDVIKCADWIIDLGPEGGEAGGTIVAAGTPEDLIDHPTSYTGHSLRMALKTKSKSKTNAAKRR